MRGRSPEVVTRLRVKSINLDRRAINADAARFAYPEVKETTRQILNLSAVQAPVDTGRLRASGKMRDLLTATRAKGVVTYSVKYAGAVHDGAAPHIIRPRKKKALKFKVDGRTVFARLVRHPGNKRRPFLRLAAFKVAKQRGHGFSLR